ncbi:hypothetical protein [Metabacillus endolithicus]|uniref:Uncharacterized protein n=1 Tax=Metabacillus endolithicus TaxID=1535204 RepID=A0ABW5C5X6_9BACI|nr:hypothetical protein [Metabacillus endolithicus]UPG66195.1 hypothetical protein MVE64_26155 [Metabacillus endolithicus]
MDVLVFEEKISIENLYVIIYNTELLEDAVVFFTEADDFAEGESEICEFNKKYYFVGKDEFFGLEGPTKAYMTDFKNGIIIQLIEDIRSVIK